MKARLLLVAGAVFFAALSWTKGAIENPVGSGRVVAGGVRGGLIRSPNPIDRSSNLVVTGNVGGGKHFRGVVPYNAISDFGGRLGSVPVLDSFLRRSTGLGYLGRYTGKPTPYYSPTVTVTTLRPGYSDVLRPPTAKIKGAATVGRLDGRIVGRLDDRAVVRLGSGRAGRLDGSRFYRFTVPPLYRPMSRSPEDLEEVVSSEVEKYLQSEELAKEQYQKQKERAVPAIKSIWDTEQFRQDLKQVSDEPTKLRGKIVVGDDALRPSSAEKPSKDMLQFFDLQRPEEQTEEQRSQAQKRAFEVSDGQLDEFQYLMEDILGLDVYEQMKQEIEVLRQVLEQTSAREGEGSGKEESLLMGSAWISQIPGGGKVRLEGAQKIARWEHSKMGTREGAQEEKSQAEKISEVGLSVAKVKTILGTHKTFASYSNDKFNQHVRAAEGYLKQGKYYRAADAYTMATIYKPEDPLAYAGKSHALFAAGEYMSNALFLSRALAIFPEYARFKIDLVAMVGDRDRLESRIADVEQWLERSGAGELQFLLGYVYYQMDRLERAKKAIDAAYEKIPGSPAVVALKEAIEDSE